MPSICDGLQRQSTLQMHQGKRGSLRVETVHSLRQRQRTQAHHSLKRVSHQLQPFLLPEMSTSIGPSTTSLPAQPGVQMIGALASWSSLLAAVFSSLRAVFFQAWCKAESRKDGISR
mmetsp:Transcript_26254/g.47337  ORF Transcript_26254/g.47337 Transcript_26254/m.47337 type:complete len:117 (+) Transcript_26254:501-851(+)